MADTVITSDRSLQDVSATGTPIPDADTVAVRTAAGSLQEVAPSSGGGGGDIPTGDANQVMGFDANGNPVAIPFRPEHWTEMLDGPPVAGVWLAAFAPEQSPDMAFAPANSDAIEGSIPIYDTVGMLKVTGGSEDGHAASIGQLNARFSQAQRDAIDGLNENSSMADLIAALQAT